MKIQISDSACDDLNEAQLFYESQCEGLGSYFQESIFADIDSLKFYAGIHFMAFGKYRLLSKRFPYAIYYTIKSDTVIVSAVLDCRKNLELIKKRLK
ncbi:MAG: type II toxin-antitoxin system RelE/ParE family toxin [Desulforegulaceae bacterium]|nr:type II toxin-antitoxin system RelE/ParE family toxin [Desulfobacteraceae bacterium]MDY0363069.1 type II toxin-antitoxin system RelE/ParE family toxin [Desulforegulaceae bacterium]